MATATLADRTLDVPEDCEVVFGQFYEAEPMSGYAAAVAVEVNAELTVFVRKSRVGRVFNETLFRVAVPDDAGRIRKPDLAYVSFDRWPADKPFPYRGNPVDAVPDLAIEIVSPTDSFDDVFDKANEYLRAGVRQVWVIGPRLKTVHVFAGSGNPMVLSAADSLDGGDVLPGFTVRVGDLFPPVTDLPVGVSDTDG